MLRTVKEIVNKRLLRQKPTTEEYSRYTEALRNLKDSLRPEETEEYNKACEITDAWAEVMDYLCDNLIKCASEDGILATGESHYGLKPFMEKYGYRDGHGWWVKL